MLNHGYVRIVEKCNVLCKLMYADIERSFVASKERHRSAEVILYLRKKYKSRDKLI
jgi:hypothetical protein